MAFDKEKGFVVQCTARDAKEKQTIRELFKKHNIPMATFVMMKLREKAKELQE
jgi:hypothetical protein